MTEKLKGLGLFFGIFFLFTLCLYCILGITVNNKTNQNLELQAKNEEIIRQLDLLSENVATLQENYIVLEARYNEALTDNTTSQETIIELEESLNSTQIQLDSANSRIEELVFELNSSDPVFGKFVDGTLTEVTAKDLTGCTAIRDYAFYGCDVEKVEIPEGVTSIGGNAFYNCANLTEVDFPETLTSIGANAFSGCASLLKIDLPNSVNSISAGAFLNCESAQEVYFPESFNFYEVNIKDYFSQKYGAWQSNIYDNASYIGTKNNPYLVLCMALNTNITSCNLSTTIKKIENKAFQSCKSLTSIVFPDGLTHIGSYSFEDADKITTITLPESLIAVGDYAFTRMDKLATINFPQMATYALGKGTFHNSYAIQTVNITGNIAVVPYSIFGYCTLSTLKLPATVTSIEGLICTDSSGLTLYCYSEIPPTIISSTFNSCTFSRIYVPEESVDVYKTANLWSNFSSYITAIPA